MIPKFRAWDKHNKKMFTNEELIIWNDNVYANDRRKLSVDKLKGWSISDKFLMQSTGLKDKNGTEIFEGDVVRFSRLSGYPFDGFLNRVTWDEHNATFKLVPLDKTWSDTYFSNFGGDTLKSLEVIGNVYEKDKLEEAINDTK